MIQPLEICLNFLVHKSDKTVPAKIQSNKELLKILCDRRSQMNNQDEEKVKLDKVLKN